MQDVICHSQESSRYEHIQMLENSYPAGKQCMSSIKLKKQRKAKPLKLEFKRNTLIKKIEEVKHLNEKVLKVIKEDEIETEIMKSCDFTEEIEVIIDKGGGR